MKKLFTVLLADDNPKDAESTSQALRDCGIPIRCYLASSAAGVLDYFTASSPFGEQNPFPDLIILDLKQPLLNGLEVLTWLRSHRDWDNLPIIVLSDSPLHRDAEDAYHLGASTCFTRPHTAAELRELVILIVFYWSWSRQAGTSKPALKESGRFLQGTSASQSGCPEARAI
jgi:CheY-like chemotaxis protein